MVRSSKIVIVKQISYSSLMRSIHFLLLIPFGKIYPSLLSNYGVYYPIGRLDTLDLIGSQSEKNDSELKTMGKQLCYLLQKVIIIHK